MNPRWSLLLMVSLGVVALVACAELASPAPSGSSRPAYSLTITLEKDASAADLEAYYDGEVGVWQPEDGFAIFGLDEGAAERFTSSLSLSASSASLEPNKDVFWGSGKLAWMSGGVSAWAGGSVSAWAGGSVSAWAGGMVSAWAGGKYAPLPENTAKWQKLDLQRAQTLAGELGAGVTVAVIDSGIDLQHPAFEGGLVPASMMWDYVENDSVPQEEGVLGEGAYGHGTNIASIILQVAPKAKILPLRVLEPDGSGDTIDVAAAISYAVTKGAKVINLSLGSEVRSAAVATAIDAATAKGVFVISSSGNTADQRVTYPASEAHFDTLSGRYSISVGSVDANDNKSSFSTYGTSLELVAPGEGAYGPVPGERLGAWTGTSMAVPMVAGALALALSEDLNLSLKVLTDRLGNEAEDIYEHNQNDAYKHLLGEGRLDIAEFLEQVLEDHGENDEGNDGDEEN